MYVKNRTRRRAAILAVALSLLTLLVCLLLRDYYHKYILFAPHIENQVMEQQGDVQAWILLKRAEQGTYQHVCRYDLEPDGSVSLTSTDYWQSYVDTISGDTFRELSTMVPKAELMQVWHLPNGCLADYWRGHDQLHTVVQTDRTGREVFRYDFDPSGYSSPCQAVLTEPDWLHILSYDRRTGRIYVDSVNKWNEERDHVSFSYEDLSGDRDADIGMGSFLPNSDNFYIRDGVLYLADSYYSPAGNGSVVAAWSMQTGQPLGFRRIPGAQVMEVWWQENGVQVLFNHKDYQPLEICTYDLDRLVQTGSVALPLPPEFLAGKGEAPSKYLLYDAKGNAKQVGVVFPDLEHGSDSRTRRTVFCVYDRDSGECVYRSEMSVNAEYEIYEVILARSAVTGI